MTTPIKYRISSTATKPVSDTVKGAPLTSLEIDGNFRSIKDSVELIQSAYLPAGYSAPVEYVAGVILSSATQTVAYQGEVYAPKAAEVPFTTSGTFEVTKFVQIQSVAGVDLAATDGASLVGYDGGTVQDVLDAVTGPNGAAYVGYTPAGTGAVVATVQSKLRETVSVKDFGAVGDGVADDTSAINAAINSVTYGTGVYVSGPAVYFPPGTYRCSQAIQLKKSVRLYGDGSGMPTASTATLKFDAGKTGIVVHRYNTINATVESPVTTAGDASIIEGLILQGQVGTADAMGGHGIWLRARAVIRNVIVNNFTGNGIHVTAYAGGGGALEGNANNFRIETCRVYKNVNGLYVDGTDANAGLITLVDASDNSAVGIYDSSFLGNTYVGCHTAGNNQPYKSDDINARNVFLGCYSEGGQPVNSYISYPSIVVGGLHAVGFNKDVKRFSGENTSLQSNVPPLRVDYDGVSKRIQSYLGATSNQVIAFQRSDTNSNANPGYSFSIEYDASVDVWNFQTGTGQLIASWSDINTTTPLSRNDFFIPSLKIGTAYVYARKLTAMPAAPTSGTWQQGDVVYNTSPTAGGYVGWVCTAGGTPGTWKTFGAISA